MKMESINPTTGEVIGAYPEATSKEINAALAMGHEAFLAWRRTSFAERASKMKMAAQIFRSQIDAFAELIATEMGKPLAQGKSEVEKCAWACDFFAEEAEKFLAPEKVQTDSVKS